VSDLHTPGPWFVAETDDNEGYPETVIRGMDGIAGVAVAIDFQKAPGMREANARLLAAAPDLLAAVREYMDIMRYADDRQALIAGIRRADEMARAAVDKATKATQ
jgi:hypothetical protein